MHSRVCRWVDETVSVICSHSLCKPFSSTCLVSFSAPRIPSRKQPPTWASSILNHVLLSLPDAICNLVPRKQGLKGHSHDSKVSWNAADYDGGNTVTDDKVERYSLWMILRSKSYNLLCLMASPKFKQSKFEPILLTSLVSSLSLLMAKQRNILLIMPRLTVRSRWNQNWTLCQPLGM